MIDIKKNVYQFFISPDGCGIFGHSEGGFPENGARSRVWKRKKTAWRPLPALPGTAGTPTRRNQRGGAILLYITHLINVDISMIRGL